MDLVQNMMHNVLESLSVNGKMERMIKSESKKQSLYARTIWKTKN